MFYNTLTNETEMEVDCKIEIEKLRLITATIFVFSNFRREFNSAGKLMSITLSVTRWLLYYFSIFCHLKQWKFAQWQTKFVKVGSKVCQILNKLSNITQKLLRLCKRCENWPNLATLVDTPKACILAFCQLSENQSHFVAVDKLEQLNTVTMHFGIL